MLDFENVWGSKLYWEKEVGVYDFFYYINGYVVNDFGCFLYFGKFGF